MKTCPECGAAVTNKANKFCSQSCAAKFNNRKNPKRMPQGACRACNAPINTSKTWCSTECMYVSHPNRDPNATHQVCRTCKENKPVAMFSPKHNYRDTQCKACYTKKHGPRVLDHRRNIKRKLVEYHGGSCVDCGYVGPYFIFEFDHRDPELKEFSISRAAGKPSRTYEECLKESLKCDLVCPNCHRWRTHRQRCSGCEFCSTN